MIRSHETPAWWVSSSLGVRGVSRGAGTHAVTSCAVCSGGVNTFRTCITLANLKSYTKVIQQYVCECMCERVLILRLPVRSQRCNWVPYA